MMPSGSQHIKDITELVSTVFHLPETSILIIRSLSVTRKALSVKEIMRSVRRSERSVRASLVELVNKGLLKRRVKVTDNKRLSYVYLTGPFDHLLKVTRREILNQLERLEMLEGDYLHGNR
jgi:predicted DNA-binding transcriptional regulator